MGGLGLGFGGDAKKASIQLFPQNVSCEEMTDTLGSFICSTPHSTSALEPLCTLSLSHDPVFSMGLTGMHRSSGLGSSPPDHTLPGPLHSLKTEQIAWLLCGSFFIWDLG